MVYLDLTQFTKSKVTVVGDMTIHTKGGVVHREDGPAIITSWSKEWYINGKAHREDGPSKMYLKHPIPTGSESIAAGGKYIAEWHIDGVYSAQAILDHETFMKHWEK